MPPTVNSLALLGGALAELELADHVANYGATTFVKLGNLKDIAIEQEVSTSVLESDNVVAEQGEFDTKQSVTIKGKILEHDLQKMALLFGKETSDVTVTARSAGVTDGTAILGIGALPAKNYQTVRLTLDPVSIKPGYSSAPNDVYSEIEYKFAKCAVHVKTSEAFKKSGQWEFPFEFKAYYDSSVTTAGSEIYKVTQTQPK